jgi:hypothetical protein
MKAALTVLLLFASRPVEDTENAQVSHLLYILLPFVLCGCPGVWATNKCNIDLGTTWANTACTNAMQDVNVQARVKALGNEGCARARQGVMDGAQAAALCKEARAKVEQAAWGQIEKATVSGQRPKLTLDDVMPGLPEVPVRKPTGAVAPETIAASPAQQRTSSLQEPLRNSPNIHFANPQPTVAASSAVVRSYSDVNSGQTNSPRQSPPNSGMGTLAYLDASNGFRDLSFGSAPLADMRLVEDDGDEKFYQRSTDDLSVGSGHLASITYDYYKYRLLGVELETRGLANSRALLDTLKAAYGVPYQPNGFLQRYMWPGAIVNVIYDESAIKGDSTSLILNKALIAADQAANKDKAGGPGFNSNLGIEGPRR